jgi:hypothetical protein
MRFECQRQLSRKEKRAIKLTSLKARADVLTEWCPWFAWYPVAIEDWPTRQCVWLELIERRYPGAYAYELWGKIRLDLGKPTYRFPEKKPGRHAGYWLPRREA